MIMNEETKHNFGAFPSVASLLLLILIFSFPMNFLWNLVLVPLFVLPLSSYWQMVGLGLFVYFIAKIARA